MKILHTISGMSAKSGGTSSSTYELIKGLQSTNIVADILSFAPEVGDKLIGNEVFIKTVPRSKYFISNAYKKALENSNYQLFHANGIWEYTELISAKTARRKKIPFVISPHGMLYPQALTVSKYKKQLFLKLFLMYDLNKSAAVHATCMEEMQHLRDLGIKSSIAIIPNSVSIPEKVSTSTPDKLRIGYLGRVHPRKNIERLLYVWDKLNLKKMDIELIIIGDCDTQYMNFLKVEKEKLNLKNVVFTGFLSGEAKEKALLSLSYIVVPSDFENFGMIIPEALIKGIPVVASKGTPWEELNTHQCGWWVDNDIDTLATTIETAIHLPEEKRIAMGKRGQELVKNNYSVEVVAKKMIQLYEWILSGGEKPEFVYVL
ncbi:MAG: glycosyltransferase [Bacteroidales bacterium]|jgi:glycosyltransferase involved in cell wall biosynthesis|nr:glycosyltransferase [Bacteroidales bacterium]